MLWSWVVAHILTPLFAPLGRALAAAHDVGTAAGVMLVLLALAALALVIVRLAVAFVRTERGGPGAAPSAPADGSELDARAWRERASEAAARGEYVRAIAALWLAALALLDERELVAFDPTRTPGEYRRLVRRLLARGAAPFEALGERFVYATYAAARPEAVDYERAAEAFAAFEPVARGAG